MNKNDWIYLAGFIDGEGSISVEKYCRWGKAINYAIKITITNSNRNVLDWVHANYGGHIATLKKKRENHHDCFQWIIRCKKAYEFIKLVEPYLKIKRELAQVALRIGARCQVKYDHYKPKPIKRQLADESDYQRMKEIIGRTNFSHNDNWKKTIKEAHNAEKD